jgi:hypothetical protein
MRFVVVQGDAGQRTPARGGDEEKIGAALNR